MSEGNVAADRLRLLIERIERLEDEKKGISDDIKDVYLEAKSDGYDPKIMRQIVRLRKMQPHDRQEMRAVLETYMAALGMTEAPPATPNMFAGHDGRPDPQRPAPAPDATDDERFNEAACLVTQHQNASTAWLQRQMRIGYNAASRLVEQLEQRGVVGPPNHVGKRTVLVPPDGGAHPALVALHKHLDDMSQKGITVSISAPGGREIALNAPAGNGGP